jgi:hypothetical protein
MTAAEPQPAVAYPLRRPDHDDPHAPHEALALAHYSTDIAAAALELASARCCTNDPPTNVLAIAEVLIRTATAIQTLAAALIDRQHTHPCGDLP